MVTYRKQLCSRRGSCERRNTLQISWHDLTTQGAIWPHTNYKGKPVTTTPFNKNCCQACLSLSRHFIPGVDLRRLVVMAALTAGVPSVYAQTSTPTQTLTQGSTVSVTAAAERTQGPAEKMIQTRSAGNPLDAAFKRADTNGDGRLSRKEAEHFPMLSQRFDSVDVDGDSFLSREEFDRAISN